LTWPLPIDPTLAYVNEPPRGSGGTNVAAISGADVTEILFAATCNIDAGAELFIDYGRTYDRSSYR